MDPQKPAIVPPEDELDAQTVTEYLRLHPDFLLKHPDAVLALRPPEREIGEGVVDLQTFLLDRIRAEVTRLKATQRKLIATSRVNLQNQSRVHAAVLALLTATSCDHLLQIITTDLAVVLDVDVVTLCVEANGTMLPGARAAGIVRLPPHAVDGFMGPNREVMLRSITEGDASIFGAAASLVRSDALVRLRVSSRAPAGLVAFGSRREGAFHPGQGTELLGFLARALEFSIRTWLDLPA
ncbi:MAG: DUF484 family protein [Proteobacteria bacterium]|nr:DUF484 family protein [Pseudomonadota bacterium]MBI3499227.1 DUF484 family protein [Pseudomonadota bacterium]